VQFDLSTQPENIVLDPNHDGDVITIMHERMSATERITAIELTDQGLSASMAYLYRKYLTWTGVTDKGGSPIPIRTSGTNGETNSNIDKVFGMLPLATQIEAWIKQLVLNGVPFAHLKSAAAAALDADTIKSLEEVAANLGKSPAPMASASSTS
jgi:hypothetical protein